MSEITVEEVMKRHPQGAIDWRPHNPMHRIIVEIVYSDDPKYLHLGDKVSQRLATLIYLGIQKIDSERKALEVVQRLSTMGQPDQIVERILDNIPIPNKETLHENVIHDCDTHSIIDQLC